MTALSLFDFANGGVEHFAGDVPAEVEANQFGAIRTSPQGPTV
jgi:hypothetical protein